MKDLFSNSGKHLEDIPKLSYFRVDYWRKLLQPKSCLLPGITHIQWTDHPGKEDLKSWPSWLNLERSQGPSQPRALLGWGLLVHLNSALPLPNPTSFSFYWHWFQEHFLIFSCLPICLKVCFPDNQPVTGVMRYLKSVLYHWGERLLFTHRCSRTLNAICLGYVLKDELGYC